jgi:glycosyltransferase involved in cell wall biosynthesis
MRAAVLSLEPWDDTWRRNQHISAELVRQGLVDELHFVEPAVRTPRTRPTRSAGHGIVVHTPTLRLPRSLGGHAELGHRLTKQVQGIDVLWINDPTLGVHCRPRGAQAVYDVTDDWREAGFPARIRRRIVRAEGALARRALTTVCSPNLRDRWRERYGIAPSVVLNGIDRAAWQQVRPVPLTGPGPHVGYIGTLHEHRLDLDLVLALAARPETGTVHLVGPNALGADPTARLMAAGVAVHGPVPAAEVPGWTCAMDVLLCPHQVDPFTLSLDAIKAHEYAASGRPVVATPTSGFQLVRAPQVFVVSPDRFVDETVRVASAPPVPGADAPDVPGWDQRAREFWAAVTAHTVLAPT